LDLTFEGRFTPADLEAVKSVAGRRWLPDRRAWRIPDTPETRDALERAFGARLRMGTGSAPEEPSVDGRRNEPSAGRRTDDPPPDRRSPARPDEVIAAMRVTLRTREYSPRTERSYVDWVRRFLAFHRDSAGGADGLDATHAAAFLEHLATRRRLAARSRNQAASALAFMFREVLGRDELAGMPRARGPRRAPTVLSHREVLRVLGELNGKYFLVGVLLYSAGLRLEECLRLRVKDIDFDLRQILVRDGKGRKDRYVPLADRAQDLLRAQIRRVAVLHEEDRAAGHGWAALPGALHRKDPRAGYDLRWQYLFPASTMNTDPATGRKGRWPLHATAVQRAVKAAVHRSGINKPASCHTLRHSFATEALRGGCDIRTLQHVMGHKDIRTTMIYLHAVEQTGFHVRSPLDRPGDPADEEDPVGLRPGGFGRQWEVAAAELEGGRRGRAGGVGPGGKVGKSGTGGRGGKGG
jgi:integron integrase